MAPWHYVVYNPDFTINSEYNEGGHEPGGNNYQKEYGFSQGDKILAIVDDVLVPCEVVGPVSVDFMRSNFDKNGYRNEEDFQKYMSRLWDWDWDTVIVHPLVKIKTEFGEISSDMTAQRIYLFPYQELKI